jgi:hypothetical protein
MEMRISVALRMFCDWASLDIIKFIDDLQLDMRPKEVE